MQSNEIKKGDLMFLKNGWKAVMFDNKKGNIRMAEVYGLCKEIGSIYVWDIDCVKVGTEWVSVDLTEKQIKAQQVISHIF
jgi:hypothetical protein